MVAARTKVEKQLRTAALKAAKADGQAAIARRCRRLTRYQLNHFLRGRCGLSLPTAVDLANAIGCKLQLTQ